MIATRAPRRIATLATAPLLGATLLLAMPAQSLAALTVRVTDGFTTQDCVDGSVCDVNTSVGVVNFNTSIGNFLLSANLALTKPFFGSADLPSLHLNTVKVSSSLPGGVQSVTILMSDTDFTGPLAPTPYSLLSGGTTSGVTFINAWVDSGNTLFGTAAPIGSQGPFSGGSFAQTSALLLSPPAPYSITLGATIQHGTGFRVTSLDAELSPTPVPLPAGIVLLGSGFVGLLGVARRRTA